MDFLDNDYGSTHDAQKRIHALKREIKALTKHHGRRLRHEMPEDFDSFTESLKYGGRKLMHRLSGHAQDLSYSAKQHPTGYTALLIGLGALTAAICSFRGKHHCH
ncbi:hypothetical protein [Bartonella sp. TP]|uniref:hypothetical protein n=1 Tax=Bartonella sp. TP TaxID=3057550 RepID=UPI0025AFC2AB|nr:hypothetical protein [Bartonella sp. TP]WJW79571.1 hypothetical protein QVL57_03360 [Bartonella sp. TP]